MTACSIPLSYPVSVPVSVSVPEIFKRWNVGKILCRVIEHLAQALDPSVGLIDEEVVAVDQDGGESGVSGTHIVLEW